LNKRYNQLIDKGSEPLLSDYISQSCVIGRRVEIWEELTDSTLSSKILGRGIIENILPDLSIQLNNQIEPICRGRLIFVN